MLSGALLAVFGLGGAALVAGVTAPPSVFTPWLVWGGVFAMALSGAGLARMFLTAPLAGPGTQLAAPTREYLPAEVTPRSLLTKVEGRTSVQVDAVTKTYAGKWLRFEGKVRNVSDVGSGIWLLQLGEEPEALMPTVSASFGKNCHSQLMALSKGDVVTIEGRINRLRPSVHLIDAEIHHIGRTEPPATKAPPRARKKAQPKA